MKTPDEIRCIVNHIKYKNWSFVIGTENSYGTSDIYLQIQFYAEDNSGLKKLPELQYCRKWRLSPFMTETEIVRTAWKAVVAAEEHEAGENFKYYNSTPFNPHLDINVLCRVSNNLDSRPKDQENHNNFNSRVPSTLDF